MITVSHTTMEILEFIITLIAIFPVSMWLHRKSLTILFEIKKKKNLNSNEMIPYVFIVSSVRFMLIFIMVVVMDKLFDIMRVFSMFLRNMIGGF